MSLKISLMKSLINNKNNNLIFYSLDINKMFSDDEYKCKISNEFNYYFWYPSINNFAPRNFNGINKVYCLIWWIFIFLHIFTNNEYCIFLIYYKDTLVHHSYVIPKYYRFPFMSESDVQIGNIWTHPNFRGKGLALFAVNHICKNKFNLNSKRNKQIQKIWYLVNKNNLSSIKVAEKAGFKKVGYGSKKGLFGLNLFVKYIINEWVI